MVYSDDLSSFGKYKKCYRCHKKFFIGLTTQDYVYVTQLSQGNGYKRYFCSYHCKREYDNEKKIEKEKRRIEKWQKSQAGWFNKQLTEKEQ